jgi:hypothetical protein
LVRFDFGKWEEAPAFGRFWGPELLRHDPSREENLGIMAFAAGSFREANDAQPLKEARSVGEWGSERGLPPTSWWSAITGSPPLA